MNVKIGKKRREVEVLFLETAFELETNKTAKDDAHSKSYSYHILSATGIHPVAESP